VKYLRLIARNAARNKRRAVLTVLSIAVAIATICVLQTIVVAFNQGVEFSDDARLVTRNATSLIFPLPYSYRSRLAAMPGVRSVSIGNWFSGVYQDKKNFFAKFAVEIDTYFGMYPEFYVPPDEFAAVLADRQGCIIGRKLAQKYGFKIGDTIPVMGDIFPGDWEFNVRAIYEGRKPSADETAMFFHWKYLDESQPKQSQGQVGWYLVQIEDPDQAGRVAKMVDAEFENSAEQTLTETERAFNLGFVKMMGNIEKLVRAIGSAVVFAILLVAANTIAMAARERTTEVAILKTIGFQGPLIGSLVLAEALLLTMVGWGIGTGVSWLLCEGVERAFPTFFPVFPLKSATVAASLVVALATGAFAGLLPALRAARTTIVAALRQVA